MILLHRHRSAFGYFWADRFGQNGSKTTVHEIALNPSHIRVRKPKETFSTLVHEMVHQFQQEHGKPPKGAYHNKQWAEMMKDVGLYPSDTAKPGGAETGRYVSHYIVPEDPFCRAYEKFSKKYDMSLFGDLPDAKKKGKGKTSKFKFVCPECSQNAWAKVTAKLVCGDCEVDMEEA
jgi:predicted SprT family Zn-dependent metalloprotease